MKKAGSLASITAGLGGILLATAGPATASGFRIPELSIAGLGTANAMVANPEELGALAYNPAAMSFHDGTNAVGGLVIIQPETSVTNTAGSFESDPSTPFYVPNGYVMGQINPDVAWGLGITAPFGLATKWRTGTFPIPAAAHPTLSKIEMVNINPNVAFRVNEGLSLAAGIDYYYVFDLALNTGGADVSGDGSDWGFNLGALYSAGSWNFGAAYRSAVEVEAEGEAVLGGTTTIPATANVNFPWIFQIGARYQATEKLSVEADFERTGWSEFDRIVVRSKATGAAISTAVNNWEDSNTYRLGATYELDANRQLRLGYSFDETPQPDAHFSARVPDNDRHLFSVGLAQKLNDWTLEVAYMYVRVEDRAVNSATPLTGADANGTAAYNGTYETEIHLLGFGLSTKF